MYIRTKDGVYEAVKSHDGHIVGLWNPEVKILNQSENLEELCDCFVTKGNKHIVWDKQHNKGIMFEQVKESYPNYHFEIYGAIWTDKGLIYVAKMDNEGKLVLI